MKLHTYFRSSAAFRVRIALNLKQLPYEPVFVHLAKGEHRKPEYAGRYPQGLLPTLVADGLEDTNGAVCVKLPAAPSAVEFNGQPMPRGDYGFDDGVLRIRFANGVRPTRILITR